MAWMDSKDILLHLPHRYPFLLVDKVLALEANQHIKALKNVSFNEQHFVGHFPNRPVMPGVLMIEALAQAAGILVSHSVTEAKKSALFYLASVDQARFKRLVVPGDQLELFVEVHKRRASIWKFSGRISCDEALVCEAQFTCAEAPDP